MPEPQPNQPASNRGSTEQRERKLTTAPLGAGITLALGGGFSRGFAHLGVLAVLEEERLPLTAIVGTSIGGLLGAAYADGVSVHDLCDLGRRVRLRDFLRLRPSDQDSRKQKDCIGQFVQEWFRTDRLEALPVHTAIVATDLDTAAPYIFTRGPVEVAIRASCAFPGLARPVRFEGRVLVDGCIAAPLPAAIAARVYGGCVLGVSVSAGTSGVPARENIGHLTGRGGPGSRRPSFEPSWSRSADILLEPAVHTIDWNDFSRVDEAFHAGVDSMRQALPALRAALAQRIDSSAATSAPLPAENWLAL